MTTFDMVVQQVQDVEKLTLETRVNGEVVQVWARPVGGTMHIPWHHTPYTTHHTPHTTHHTPYTLHPTP